MKENAKEDFLASLGIDPYVFHETMETYQKKRRLLDHLGAMSKDELMSTAMRSALEVDELRETKQFLVELVRGKEEDDRRERRRISVFLFVSLILGFLLGYAVYHLTVYECKQIIWWDEWDKTSGVKKGE